jgi:RHS repeat-associated protein
MHPLRHAPNAYLYRGEQYDSDLGLYYLRARYYNPMTGRFMSRDPEEGTPHIPATLHKYLYVTLVGNGMGKGAMKIVRGVVENAINAEYYPQVSRAG